MAETLTVDGVMNALRNCYDPEIPVNIVDLGLVYNVAIDEDNVKVRMTLTTMGCPAHAYLMHQVQTEIEKIPGVKKAEVEIVWDPPWTPDNLDFCFLHPGYLLDFRLYLVHEVGVGWAAHGGECHADFDIVLVYRDIVYQSEVYDVDWYLWVVAVAEGVHHAIHRERFSHQIPTVIVLAAWEL